jgi:hypothetical protein
MKKSVAFCALAVLCLSGCAKTEPQNADNTILQTVYPSSTASGTATETPLVSPVEPDETSELLDQWIGAYQFYEYQFNPDQSMHYDFFIHEEDGVYYAHCYIFGYKTLNEFQASLKGDRESIEFVFDDYTGYNLSEPYKKGELLLTLTKKQGTVITDWGVIRPMLTLK